MNKLTASAPRFNDTMKRMAFFQDWPADVVNRLSIGASLVTVSKNSRLARKGERLEHLYILIDGQMRLYIPLPNEMERVVVLVSPGESLGEACLVLNEACPYHAVAGKDSHLLAIDGHLFRRELSRQPLLAHKTVEVLARRLMDNMRDTEICAQRSSVQRVACFLIQHRPVENADSYQFSLPARKQDIAAKLGLTQETFSRMLGFLQKQGLIQVNGAQIQVDDSTRLAQISLREER